MNKWILIAAVVVIALYAIEFYYQSTTDWNNNYWQRHYNTNNVENKQGIMMKQYILYGLMFTIYNFVAIMGSWATYVLLKGEKIEKIRPSAIPQALAVGKRSFEQYK